MNLISQKRIIIVTLVIGLLFLFQVSSICYAQEIRLIFGHATTPTSSDYPEQVALGEIGASGIPGSEITITAVGGSQAALPALLNREADVISSGCSSCYEYLHGIGAWEGHSNPNNIRVLHFRRFGYNPIAVRADSDIYQVSDLEGKRVFYGFTGTSCESNSKNAIARALGIKANEYVGSLSDGVEAMKDRRIDAFTKTVTGNRIDSTHIDIMTNIPLRFIGFNWEQIERIQSQYPWILYEELPKGFFPDMPDQEAFIANKTMSFVVCRDDFPEEYAYQWTKAICENWDKIVELSPGSASVDQLSTPKYISALDQLYIHPGALRYYMEKEAEIPESVIPPEMR